MKHVFDNKGNSIENVNVDVVRRFSEIIMRSSEVDITILLESPLLHDVIMLFSETLVRINHKETNNELVLFFSFLIAHRNTQQLVFKYI